MWAAPCLGGWCAWNPGHSHVSFVCGSWPQLLERFLFSLPLHGLGTEGRGGLLEMCAAFIVAEAQLTWPCYESGGHVILSLSQT